MFSNYLNSYQTIKFDRVYYSLTTFMAGAGAAAFLVLHCFWHGDAQEEMNLQNV